MSNSFSYTNPEFDKYAENYDQALARGISISGEDKHYFAERRIRWLTERLRELNFQPRSVLDFGCGTGSATNPLREIAGCSKLIGIDTSEQSLHVARRSFPLDFASFLLMDQYQPGGEVDLAFCNGVFHHIPPAERAAAMQYVYRSLRPGGIFAVWENNPWNPGTRYVMSRIPFDRDAIPVTPPTMRKLLTAGGFKILRTDFLFIFPRMLRWFRALEPSLSRYPLGAQYQFLGVKAEI